VNIPDELKIPILVFSLQAGFLAAIALIFTVLAPR